MPSIQAIGEQIRAVRKAKGLSASKVAELAAVHPNTLRALEKGTGNVELTRLLSICDSLGLKVLVVPKEVAALRAAEGASTSTELADSLRTLMGEP